MRISSVKPAPWLAVNLHHLFSNGAAFNTLSRRSLTSYAISLSLLQMNRLRYERDIASLVSDLRLCVLNAAPFENRWWRLTANQGAGFTDEMRMHIAWDISPSPSLDVHASWYSFEHELKTDTEDKKLLNKVVIFVFFTHKCDPGPQNQS